MTDEEPTDAVDMSTEECHDCFGLGSTWISGVCEECPTCNGTGEVEVSIEECRDCFGQGHRWIGCDCPQCYSKCLTCDGTGQVGVSTDGN
jgi:hypothetical protein